MPLVFVCPDGAQAIGSDGMTGDQTPTCASGSGYWQELSAVTPWAPSLDDISLLLGTAVLVWGVAWGFKQVIKFTAGRR